MPFDGPLGELVSFEGAGRLRLDGILYRAPASRATVVHAHGSFGNFYQNPFVRVLARALQNAGYNFLSFNLSAHDGLCEGYFANGSFAYVGASLVGFETCIDDIAGAVAVAEQLGAPVVLSGHSLGSDRVVSATKSWGWDHPIILLAPCDSYELQSALIQPESVEDQRERLMAQRPPFAEGPPSAQFDWIPLREYGVRATTDWTYPNPITRAAFLSISCGDPYSLFRYRQLPSWRLDNRALIVTPANDALLTCSPLEVDTYFRHALTRGRHRVVGGDHLFTGAETGLAACVLDWLREL